MIVDNRQCFSKTSDHPKKHSGARGTSKMWCDSHALTTAQVFSPVAHCDALFNRKPPAPPRAPFRTSAAGDSTCRSWCSPVPPAGRLEPRVRVLCLAARPRDCFSRRKHPGLERQAATIPRLSYPAQGAPSMMAARHSSHGSERPELMLEANGMPQMSPPVQRAQSAMSGMHLGSNGSSHTHGHGNGHSHPVPASRSMSLGAGVASRGDYSHGGAFGNEHMPRATSYELWSVGATPTAPAPTSLPQHYVLASIGTPSPSPTGNGSVTQSTAYVFLVRGCRCCCCGDEISLATRALTCQVHAA